MRSARTYPSCGESGSDVRFPPTASAMSKVHPSSEPKLVPRTFMAITRDVIAKLNIQPQPVGLALSEAMETLGLSNEGPAITQAVRAANTLGICTHDELQQSIMQPQENWHVHTSKTALEAARFDPASGTVDVALIDGEWLLQLDGPIPCRQQLPTEALFQGSVEEENVVVLAISYPWLAVEHPDPQRWHLGVVKHFLRLFFTLQNKGGFRSKFSCPPTGQGKRVAIFWDWMSLFQEHSPEGCTGAQIATSMRARERVTIWFSNTCSLVWRLTRYPHDVTEVSYARCLFECAVSELITPNDRVLDLGLATREDGTCFRDMRFYSARGGGGWTAAEDDPDGGRYPTVAKTCSRPRKFPLVPAAFNEALRSCVFTSAAEEAMLVKVYEKTFREVMGEASLILSNCFISADLSDLQNMLEVCSTSELRVLDLSKNKLTGTLDVLSMCENLELLKLEWCSDLAGSFAPLGTLVNLRELNLRHCHGLSGDFQPLSSLSSMQVLNLQACHGLVGDLQPLRTLVNLLKLDLRFCTSLQGSLEPLTSLVQLVDVNLSGCLSLTGSLEPLRGHGNLEFLNLHGCWKITGDLQPLRDLMQLKEVNLIGCGQLSWKSGKEAFRQARPDCNIKF